MHHTTQRVENSLGCEVFGGDEVDEVLLTIFLLDGLNFYSTSYSGVEAHLLDNLIDGGVDFFERCGEQLYVTS